VIGAVGALAGLAPFLGLVGLVDELLAQPLDRGSLVAWCLFVVIGLVAKAVLSFLGLGIAHFADVRLQAILRRRIVARLGRVPLGWFTEQSSGRVRKAAMGDVHELHQMVAHHAVEMTAAITMPIGGVAFLLLLDWRLALLALVPFPVYVALYAWMMRDFTAQMQRMDESNARISSAVAEFVSGIAVVKTFGRARQAHQAYRSATADYVSAFSAWARSMLRLEAIAGMVISPPVVGLVTTLGAAWFVDQGWVQVSEALACVLVALVLPSTVQPLVYAAQDRRTAEAAAVRIHDLLLTPELPVADAPGTPAGYRVEFDRVRFRYDDDTDVLHEVTLTCEPGTVTALVGPSGSGKSTLAALLLRFHDTTGGEIRIGGVPVAEMAPAELHRQVGFVLQDVQLLQTTVRDNVRLGRPAASDADIERACRAARIHDRILALPRGYDSVIGEEAVLSGGEAQRVSIARALLADAPILVLDEATAFADAESESAIQDALSELAQGRTVLVIAHRLRTITGAGRIAVLEQGRVVGTGRHDELLASGGLYTRMWAAHEGEGR
jgi:ATP-binding cassette subfamily B protein